MTKGSIDTRWTRRISWRLLGLAGLLAAVAPHTNAEAIPASPTVTPNILFIIMDDVGIDQMRVFGYAEDNQARTPSIDTIALAGVRFRNAWSMPECSPSRVSFFTGRYPLRTGVVNISLDNTLANSQMSPFEATTPRVLRGRGYKNGFFGKWHHTAFASNDPSGNPNPGNPSGNAAPRDLGWDIFVGMLEGAPRGIDTTAGGVAPTGTYSCGFVNNASFGACYQTNGSCAQLGGPSDPPNAVPGRTCLERGGILVPGAACQATVPAAVTAGFQNFNGYYVAPHLINHPDGTIELIAGFDDHGQPKPPLDPRARRYLTTQQTDSAIAWIKQQPPGTPWMATLSFSAAHLPTQQPPRDLAGGIDSGQLRCDQIPSQRIITNQMIEAMDVEIGRLLVEVGLATRVGGQLQYTPDATNTMIVLLGDNGSYFQTVRLPFDPTRGKGTVYQTGVSVPLIVSGPLVAPTAVGREVTHMVNAAVDVFALFGEVAGVDVRAAVPPSHTLDARPLLPYLSDPGRPSIRRANFTQTGTVLSKPAVAPPCVLTQGPVKVCVQILTFQELCQTEGGQWFGPPTPNLPDCCAVQAQDQSIVILPHASAAVRDDDFKLVRNEVVNCGTPGTFDLQYEFYQINENAPLPKIDLARSNLLANPTLPPTGLTRGQLARFNQLKAELDAILASEPACLGDGDLDKRINGEDVTNWQTFADLCVSNPNKCSSVYDINLDGFTDGADLQIIQSNLTRRCP